MADQDPATRNMPAAAALVAQARARLAAELADMPPWGSPLLRARLLARVPRPMVSLGALVHYIRAAVQSGEQQAAQQLFVLLLERTAGLNRQWAARAVARTPGLHDAHEQICDDLHQELTMRLWEQVALQTGEQWELFFRRALDFAQRHTATAYMERHGYWTPPGIAQPTRVRTLILSMLGLGEDGALTDGAAMLADGADHFSRAELADLRGLVLRLPPPERAVLVMRYWQQAGESEIAAALGVTTRTVRNHHRRACARLKEWYAAVEETP